MPNRAAPKRCGTQQIPKQVVPHGMRSVGEVLCSVDNGELELLPNINVEVTVLILERRDVVVVPRAAVREIRQALRFCCGRRETSTPRDLRGDRQSIQV